jgi:inner membrane protein
MGAGALAAMAPDLDVLLRRTSDPLYQLELHRQFSHCLLFAPLGALAISLALWWAGRHWLSFLQLYLACLAGIATAGLLDACTSYGTQLLWPFSSTRIAWNLAPVVDPIFTIVLLLLLAACAATRLRPLGALAGLWVLAFLLHGGVQQQRALEAAQGLHLSRGHHPAEVVVKPTLGNQILWRVNYVEGGRLYVDAVRTGFWSTPRVYPGESLPLVDLARDFPNLAGTRTFQDFQRFSTLSQGYLVRHPDDPGVLGDGRYAMLPTSLKPLWGLRFDQDHPDQAPTFVTFRDSGPTVRQQFSTMLWGAPAK